MTDQVIESHDVLQSAPLTVPIIQRAIEIKISHNHPIEIILYVEPVEPRNELPFLRFSAGTID